MFTKRGSERHLAAHSDKNLSLGQRKLTMSILRALVQRKLRRATFRKRKSRVSLPEGLILLRRITPAARREFSFPGPVDVHGDRSDEQNKNETDERQAALQSIQAVEAGVSAANSGDLTSVAVSAREGKMTKCRHPPDESLFTDYG
jgi:hypothetical protein